MVRPPPRSVPSHPAAGDTRSGDATARWDLLALVALALLAFATAWRFALFDRLVEAARRLEGLPVDALVVAVLILAFGLKVYAWRRWREARRALADRLQAEASLRAHEAQLGLLTRQIPAFLWTTDADLRLTAFSGGGFRRGGIDPRGRVGLTVAEFFGVADPAFPPLAAHRRALGGDPAEYPLHRDGRAYEVRVEPLRDAAGAIVGTLGLGVDVTERARAATALRDSEARFRALFEHAAIGIGMADLDRRPLMVNPALARLTGRVGNATVGHGLGHATHPEDAARDDALFAELVAGRRDHYQLEKRYLRPDGTTAWGRLTTSLVRDAAGAPQYAIGMVEEITARMAAEGALRAREARYRAVVEQAAEGIFLFEAESKRIVEANPAFRRLLGYAETAMAGLILYDLVAHDRASVDANTARIVADGQHAIGERDYRCKDGATVPVEVSATALRGDAGPLLCVVVRDLSARRMADAALRASEARLRTVVEHAPIILFTLDTAGMVTFVAGSGLAALGHAPEAIVGYPVFAGEPCPRAIGDYARRALAGATVEGGVAVRDLVFSTHYAPFRDEAGAVAGVIGVATDVTARATAETERDEARRLLAVEREAERLRIAWALHDGPVQQLLGVRHHLAAIGRRLTRERLPDDVVPALAVIEGELVAVARELRGLIGTLRPVGLEERGLLGALAEHVARLRREDERIIPTITLTLDPAAGDLPLPVARTLLRVAQEAIRNTLRHADAGRVDVCLTVGADTAVLIVTDDGRGACMPTQLSALARAGHFGLAGLEEKVVLSRGSFTMVSRPGVGTTVTTRLPYAAPESTSDRTR